MKQCLAYYYNIEVIGFIRLSKYTYKLKTNETFYCLKYEHNKHIQITNDHIQTLHLQCFVDLIKNKDGQVITTYQNQQFYLMPWLEFDHSIAKELKIKYYLETLAYLHKTSFFQCSVTKEYFDTQINELTQIIVERKNYYLEVMKNYEMMHYKSPTGWMYVLNYQRVEEMLQQAYNYLQRYQNCVTNLDKIRVCLVYDHFDYTHIFMKEKKLISIDSMHIDICIDDLHSMYQKTTELFFDVDAICAYYLESIHLFEYEKLLLCCKLCTLPFIEIQKDEVENIITMSRLFYYIDSVKSLCDHIKID